MRIWILNHYALPPDSRGGPTRHLGLSRALAARGHDVTIIASAFDHYTRTNHREVQGSRRIEEIDGVRYVWVPTPPYGSLRRRAVNMLAFAWRALRVGRSLELPRPDIVLGSSPHLFTAIAARRLAKAFAVPFIFEVRDVWPQSLIDVGDMSDRHPGVRALVAIERWAYRTADRVIVVPPLAVEHVVAGGAEPGSVAVLPNGVDLEGNRAPSASAPRNERFTVVYAGTIGLANGLEVVVDAAARLRASDGVGSPPVLFRLVGAGPERPAIQRRIEEADVESIVSLEDPIPSSEVPELLASSDACLLVLRPSPVFQWGISPTKLFDYMAAARPVISVVDAPDDPSILAGAGIRCPAGNAEALADAVLALRAMSAEQRAAMGERGRAYVEANHSFSSLAARLEDLLAASLGAAT